jgi:hypothetical protein
MPTHFHFLVKVKKIDVPHFQSDDKDVPHFLKCGTSEDTHLVFQARFQTKLKLCYHLIQKLLIKDITDMAHLFNRILKLNQLQMIIT